MRAELIQITVATLGRAPSPQEMTKWLAQLEGGKDLGSIAEDLMLNGGGVGRFAGVDNTAILVNAYQAVFGREPDSQGLQYWLNEFASGRVDLGNLIPSLIAGANAPSGNPNDQLVLAARAQAAEQFLTEAQETGEFDPRASAEVVSNVDRSSVAEPSDEVPDSQIYDPSGPTPSPSLPTEVEILTVADDDIINKDEADNSFTITGVAKPEANVEIFQDGSAIGSVTAGANGEWIFTMSPGGLGISADATIDFKATHKNAFGDVVSEDTVSIDADVTLPVAPTLALDEDTGASGSDDITSNGQVNVTGLEPDATWEYSVDGGTNWADGVGTAFVLTEGSYAAADIEVRQTDAAGNQSTSGSFSGTVTVDTTVPSAPTATFEDTGPSGPNTDGITSNGQVDITDLESGASWQYTTNGGTDWVDGSGTSFDVVEGDYTAGAIKVRQVDVAGNESTEVDVGILKVDETAPSAAPSVALHEDTGTLNNDGVTNNGQMDVTGIDTGAVWEYSVDDGGSWASGSGGSFVLDEGDYAPVDIKVRQFDKAGNVSANGGYSQGVEVDTTALTLVSSSYADDDGSGDINANDTVEFTFDGPPADYGSVGGPATGFSANALIATVTLTSAAESGDTVTITGVVDVAGNAVDVDFVL